MKLSNALLLQALRDPTLLARLHDSEWDLLIRQGRAAGLLGRLGARAIEHDLVGKIPARIWHHLEAMLSIADRQRRAVLWEVKLLSRALMQVDAPILLLKGAAYAAAGLAPAAGRTFSDIDIMAPKTALAEVENCLRAAGWVTTKMDAYDQRYYRQWMHELPPMTHLRRGTNLDLHHNILPETARIRTRPDLILQAAQPLPGYPNIFIPSSCDQVLHSATHLYHEGEWEHGLRDLSDLDCLLRTNAEQVDFWPNLLKRAHELNLTNPLGHALSHTGMLLQTPTPYRNGEIVRSNPVRRKMMDMLFINGLSSAHSSLNLPGTRLAQFLLFVRSHWLRMPLHLLIPHLLHKALIKKEKEDDMSNRQETDAA